MKTITYNPDTHVLVPREPSEDMFRSMTDGFISINGDNRSQFNSGYDSMLFVALCANDIELWIDRCPHCGKPRHNHPPTYDELLAALGSGGRHCNDDTPHSDLCEAIIDSKEADLGQGLDPFWKWAFRRGFHEAETSYKVDIATLEQQRDELMAALKVARDGIDKFLVANDPTEFGCACDPSVGYLCGPCHADKQQQPLKSALDKINEVLKPGAKEEADAWAKMRKETL